MRVTSVKWCFPQNRNKNKTTPVFIDSIHSSRKRLFQGILQFHSGKVRHTVNTSIAQIPLYRSWNVSGAPFRAVCQIWYIWQPSSLLSYWIKWRDGDIYLSDSPLIKEPKDKLPLFGGMSTNREHWPALKSERVCESDSPTLICSRTCTLLKYFHFLLLYTSAPLHFRGNIVLLYYIYLTVTYRSYSDLNSKKYDALFLLNSLVIKIALTMANYDIKMLLTHS